MNDIMPHMKNIFEAFDLGDPDEVQCDICGDCHDKDRVPFGCQTGDGE